ncbi:hypothetical protein EDC14_1004174 [Hydrogenispora ethanolica]|uniref:Uncharacterized protein n=1 Tax=Hydrogenispora ethanolica TaxID=1082276 RepID=A0A4R1S4N1_HYDET|nr:hypothetical protein [Hydrogenispora ethanolica]TCL74236.1 hypothetical protein EDC14_1004174 [Hydrogenispora ethanolica]
MKDYGIWLKSGGYIEGTMDDKEAERLQKCLHGECGNELEEFTDTEGKLFCRRSHIVAIAIKEPFIKEEMGFKKVNR